LNPFWHTQSPPRKFSSKGEELYVRGLEKLKEREKKHEEREKEIEQEELESLKKTPKVSKTAQNTRKGVSFAEYTRLWVCDYVTLFFFILL
jgi:hypothetical protein